MYHHYLPLPDVSGTLEKPISWDYFLAKLGFQGTAQQDLVDVAAEAAQIWTAGCTAEAQEAIAKETVATLMSRPDSAAVLTLAGAIIIALRPGTT